MQTTWLERGTVSGRVALLLRSAEIQPLFIDLSDWMLHPIPPSTPMRGRNYRVSWFFNFSTKAQPHVRSDRVLGSRIPCCSCYSCLQLCCGQPEGQSDYPVYKGIAESLNPLPQLHNYRVSTL